MRNAFLIIGILCAGFAGFGQTDDPEKKERLLENYFSIQLNELIRQVLNLSNSAPTELPYYLNYALNHRETGWGIHTGFGYSQVESHEGDAINKVETTNSNWSLRIGPEKKFFLGKRIVLGVGIDYLRGQEEDKSNTRVESTFLQFNETLTKNSVFRQGYGPRLSVSYRFSKWLLAGTDMNYYYVKSKHSSYMKETISNFQLSSVTERNEDFEEGNVSFQGPVVFYLVLNF